MTKSAPSKSFEVFEFNEPDEVSEIAARGFTGKFSNPIGETPSKYAMPRLVSRGINHEAMEVGQSPHVDIDPAGSDARGDYNFRQPDSTKGVGNLHRGTDAHIPDIVLSGTDGKDSGPEVPMTGIDASADCSSSSNPSGDEHNHHIGTDEQTSIGIEQLKFVVVDPVWPNKLEEIKSLNVKYKAVWDVELDGGDENSMLRLNGDCSQRHYFPRAAFLRVRKWTRKVNLFEKDYTFIPVNFSLHWSLILIFHAGEVMNFEDDNIHKSVKVPCIFHMDSIKGSHTGLKDIIQWLLEIHSKGTVGNCIDEQQLTFSRNDDNETCVELVGEGFIPAKGNLSASLDDQGIEITLLTKPPLRSIHCVSDSGIVLRELFEPGATTGSFLGQLKSFEQMTSFCSGTMSPIMEEVEGDQQLVYSTPGEAGETSKDPEAENCWDPGLSMETFEGSLEIGSGKTISGRDGPGPDLDRCRNDKVELSGSPSPSKNAGSTEHLMSDSGGLVEGAHERGAFGPYCAEEREGLTVSPVERHASKRLRLMPHPDDGEGMLARSLTNDLRS